MINSLHQMRTPRSNSATSSSRSAVAGRRVPVVCRAVRVCAQQQRHEQQQQQQPQRPFAAAAAAAALIAAAALAGPAAADILPDMGAVRDAQRQKLAAAEEAFQGSDTLKRLKERSEANRARNKKAVENKYCYRQAELGVGDCGGLRYIPGMTKSGKQKTPDFLADLLGVDKEQLKGPAALEGRTLDDLLKVE